MICYFPILFIVRNIQLQFCGDGSFFERILKVSWRFWRNWDFHQSLLFGEIQPPICSLKRLHCFHLASRECSASFHCLHGQIPPSNHYVQSGKICLYLVSLTESFLPALRSGCSSILNMTQPLHNHREVQIYLAFCSHNGMLNELWRVEIKLRSY